MPSPLYATLTSPAIDDILRMPDEAAAAVKVLVPYIMKIDAQLMKIDLLLNQLQPPYSGKLRIEFWEKNGKKQPMPAIWKRSRAGKWRAELVSATALSKRVKSERDFHDNAPLIRELARVAAGLLAKRVAANEVIGYFGRRISLTRVKNEGKLAAIETALDGLMETYKTTSEGRINAPFGDN